MTFQKFLLTTVMLTSFGVAPAWAGFTLINPAAQTGTVTTITPDRTVTETTIIDGATAPIETMPIVSQPLATPSGTTKTTVQTLAAPPMPMPSRVSSPVFASAAQAVRGFGRDIPLIIAAKQIAPEDAQIALANGVNPQQPISWQSGADWHTVLNTALAAKNLSATIQGNVVVIGPNGGEPVMPMIAQPVSMPVPASGMLKDNFNSPRDAATPVVERVVKTPASPMPVPASMSLGRKTAPLVETKTVVTMAPTVMGDTLPPAVDQPLPLTSAMDAPGTVTTVAVSQPSAMPLSSTANVTMLPDTAGAMGGTLEIWKAKSGTMLHETLTDWTKRAGVTLRWDTEYDYPLQTAVSIDGDFEGAVRTLLRGFGSAQPQPVAKLYRGKDVPSVLLVTQRGNNLATVKE